MYIIVLCGICVLVYVVMEQLWIQVLHIVMFWFLKSMYVLQRTAFIKEMEELDYFLTAGMYFKVKKIFQM